MTRVVAAEATSSAGSSQVMRGVRPAAELSVAQALVNILEQEGVTHIFGVPGGPLTGLFEATRHSKSIQFVLAKHECGAAYMAASHARVTGRLAVCCATSGPGATNALTGIAGAKADSLPVLLLTGQVALGAFGKGAIQESSVFETDLVSVFRPVTKLSVMLPSADRAVSMMQAAVRTALGGRQGPVHLNLPADLLRRPSQTKADSAPAARIRPPAADPAAVREVASLLGAARRPVILAGHGTTQARAALELERVAHLLDCPVMTSPKGKGVFPESSRLSLGVLGFGGHQCAEDLLRSGDVDVLLILGSSLNEFVSSAWTLPISAKTAVIQVDLDPGSLGRNYAVDIPILADVGAFLRQLELEPDLSHQARVRRTHQPGRRGQGLPYEEAALLDSDAAPLKPQRLMKELRAAMPDDALLFVDNGTSIIWGGHYFETRAAYTYYVDLGLASMGSAVAGVVGGALGAPDRRCVALVGDAAFAMHGFEVHTAVEYGLPVVWVVLNNYGHGMVHQGDTLMHGAPLGVSDFGGRIDAAAMARAVGARGVTVRDPQALRDALRMALQANGPTVIDALIDETEPVPTFARRVQTLKEFFSSNQTP